MSPTGTTPDPTNYPKLKVGSEELEVLFRCGDIIRLKKEHKIDALARPPKGDAALDWVHPMDQMDMEQTCQMLAAGLAHIKKFDPLELADLIPFSDFPLVMQAIIGAILKVRTQAMQVNQPAATAAS